jgi:predicted ribosomally synthesized peptide with SipW-like signal peptide
MKKIGLLCLALVLAVGALGIGYAAWTDTITIGGSVTTGDVCIEFTCPFGPSGESEDASPPYTAGEGASASSFDWNATVEGSNFWLDPVRMDKNVAWVTSNCTEVTPPRKAVTLTFHNVYPSYFSHIAFGIHNCGTIPVKLDHVTFTDANGNAQTLYDDGYLVFDLSNNGTNDFELYWGDNFGDQIEPCSGWSMDFWTHFMQDEGIDFSVPHTYTLTIEIVVVQWDGYPLK